MKKMNVTFKSLLGFAFVLAIMVFGTTATNAQSELMGGQADIVGVTGTKDAALVSNFSFTGVNFLGANEAKQALVDATNQLADDLEANDDVVQNRAFVTGTFYRNIVTSIDAGLDVPTSILGAYAHMELQTSTNPFSDFITPQDVFADTVTMLSN
jgi:hypothetical protein